MGIATSFGAATQWWAVYYSDHQMVSLVVRYVHLAALMVGGGTALAIDRLVLGSARTRTGDRRRAALNALHGSHAVVVPALIVVTASGVLMAAADWPTFAGVEPVLDQDGLVRPAARERRGAGGGGARVCEGRRHPHVAPCDPGVGNEFPVMALHTVDGRVADGCRVACGASRRRFMTQISGVVLAAMVGGDAVAAKAVYVVGDMTGIAAGPDKKAYPLPAADGVTIDKDTQVILVRLPGQGDCVQPRLPAREHGAPVEAGGGPLRVHQARFEVLARRHVHRRARDAQYGSVDDRPRRRQRGGRSVELVKSDAQPAEWKAAAIDA